MRTLDLPGQCLADRSQGPRHALKRLQLASGASGVDGLPFGPGDATAGVENELQAVVVGDRETVDLPLSIEHSGYYANLKKRLHRGELPQNALTALDGYLEQNPSQVWENSWVRLPQGTLCPQAQAVLERDLLADKQNPAAGRRGDYHKFFCRRLGQDLVRLPVSYLLKLALAQAMGCQESPPALLLAMGRRLQEHFLSDNTSPETYSFHVAPLSAEDGMGRAVARETAKRFLLTSLLVAFAQESFQLTAQGQRPLVYFAPHPPVRQKQLNACISDSFYRELFMSPCLSGWDRGEEKHRYMHLCHQVLSRSQLNGLAKLREAGIIQNNLVVLPHTSNISLANNGTHLSLGSRLLTRALGQVGSGFGPAQEKLVGDLVIKFVEHFLPLFVGTYTAAPYRLGFADFHPESALGFLPHELDYTHLRMLWRRWRKKADLKALGVRVTPFGPPWLDRLVATVFRLHGDLVPDFRLIDYLAAVLSTEQSPSLDGVLDNQERLKRDLAQSGVFDEKMSVYMLYRQREFARMGFSGFEGRHYSLFPSLTRDLAGATDLQVLLTALAFQLIAQGQLGHGDIPDDPQVESERRQIFFGAAVGVPTFFVHKRTGNRLLLSLIARVPGVRSSRRYPNYLRVRNLDYRRALVGFLRQQATNLAEALGLAGLLNDLGSRLEHPQERAAAQTICQGVLGRLGARRALEVPALDFNQAAEAYYREDLRRKHLQEGLESLAQDLASPEFRRAARDPSLRQALAYAAGQDEPSLAVRRLAPEILGDSAPPGEVLRLINLLLISFQHDAQRAAGGQEAIHEEQNLDAASVC